MRYVATFLLLIFAFLAVTSGVAYTISTVRSSPYAIADIPFYFEKAYFEGTLRANHDVVDSEYTALHDIATRLKAVIPLDAFSENRNIGNLPTFFQTIFDAIAYSVKLKN